MVGERLCFAPADREGADSGPIPHQGKPNQAPYAGGDNSGCGRHLAESINIVLREIELEQMLATDDPLQHRMVTGFSLLAQRLDHIRCHIPRGDKAGALTFDCPENPIEPAAQPDRLFKDDIEYRGEVTRRGIDDLQYLGGRGLLLQRLARLSDQPRVLHRDDCLCGEIFQKSDLLVGKRANLLAVDGKSSEHRLVLAQRHHQNRADTAEVKERTRQWEARAIPLVRRNVGNLDDPLALSEPLVCWA